MVCRYTDNPNNGFVSSQYPLKGGAYFDVLSYHCYPHIDGSLREWDNKKAGFRYFRHSDAAIAGMLKQKRAFTTVLDKYGYNGTIYPQKHTIITEINIPRKAYQAFIGSEEAQVNFMVKALVVAQMNEIKQIHIYNLADAKPAAKATDEFDYMGLFQNLDGVRPYSSVPNAVAYAYRTTSILLGGCTFDAVLTRSLNLPLGADGGAFRDKKGNISLVLWAKTTLDMDETAHLDYRLPASFHANALEIKAWNYAETKQNNLVLSAQIPLSSSPVFLTFPYVTRKE
jgi:hypothetical protein